MSGVEVHVDVLIIGAGGAGLMCAIEAGRRGRVTRVIDHAKKVGGKILISGGGRCNFTNRGAGPGNYVSSNPHFVKSALARYRPEHFVELVKRHQIAFHEKKLGQLFCDGSAQAIVQLLLSECQEAGAEIDCDTQVVAIHRCNPGFKVETSRGPYTAQSLVIATGGLSIPKVGATGAGYDWASQFGLTLVQRDPALDGFVWAEPEKSRFGDLTGLSIDCILSAGGLSFRENILFTHTGLSGPASLQASLHWRVGAKVTANLWPDENFLDRLISLKRASSLMEVATILSERWPRRLSERWCEIYFKQSLPLAQIPDRTLEDLAQTLHAWSFVPAGTVGYNKAEVTRGGVDTDELSSKTMESKKVPGLYFIGEVVDVTGWLGGYNFQWAWASGHAAGQVV